MVWVWKEILDQASRWQFYLADFSKILLILGARRQDIKWSSYSIFNFISIRVVEKRIATKVIAKITTSAVRGSCFVQELYAPSIAKKIII